jgi:molybdopterin molybdotransferase
MISVADAGHRIVSAFSPLAAETVALADAYGRVLAGPLRALRTQPPVAQSAMDGWAVRAADLAKLPASLIEVGRAVAGQSFSGRVEPGQAVRIFTGATLPQGADWVVVQENVTAQTAPGGVTLAVRDPGQRSNIRQAGLDFQKNAAGLAAGVRLDFCDLALAAAMNHPTLSVRRRPRIAILATGDELVRPGEPIGPDQIVASNNVGLAALVADAGGEAIDLGIAPDRVEALAECAAKAVGKADLLVTIGGASVGDADLVHRVLGGGGASIDFWKIAMRPGKPLMFGNALGQLPLLGLPGNPVSALVCGLLFLVPAIRAMLGQTGEWPLIETARAGCDLPANDSREDYLRATLSHGPDGDWFATPAEVQDSSMMSVLAHADCLLIRGPHAPALGSGDEVPIIRLKR